MARISRVAKVTEYLNKQIAEMVTMEEKASKEKQYFAAALHADFVERLTIALSLVDDTQKEDKK